MSGRNVKIVCVLKRSPIFDVDYVDHLYAQAQAHMPDIPFYCISNVPVKCNHIPMANMYPKWWSKMELFRPDIGGDIFFLDLDTFILNPFYDLLEVGKLTMLSDFYKPDRLASGLMYIPEDDRAVIFEHFRKHGREVMNRYRRGGDQEYLEELWGTKPARWQKLFPKRVISYKAHRVVVNGVNPAVHKILCFHGRPKPRDVGWSVSGMPTVKPVE